MMIESILRTAVAAFCSTSLLVFSTAHAACRHDDPARWRAQ